MTGNAAQKTPFARSLERFTDRKFAGSEAMQGKSFPASVTQVVSSGIVQVKFELSSSPYTLMKMTVPILFPEYVRLPIQVGMLGMVVSADAYLGGVSGLGGGTADLTPRPNLSNLAFLPIGNSGWSATDDPNKVVIYGPNGAIIRDAGSKNKLDINQGGITFTVTAGGLTVNLPSGQPMTINGNAVITGGLQLGGTITGVGGGVYGGSIHTSGAVTAGFGTGNQVNLQTMNVSGVQPGSGQSGPPVPGT